MSNLDVSLKKCRSKNPQYVVVYAIVYNNNS